MTDRTARRRLAAALRPPLRALAALAAAATAATNVSCWLMPPRVQTPVAVPEKFSQSGGEAAPAKWWTAFGDEDLNALVDEALAGNLTLRTTWDRLEQARAVARKSGAPLQPSLTGEAGAARTASRTVGLGRSYRTDLSFGLVASYELDLWGRIRSTRDAADMDVRASQEDLRAAAITLAAQVAAAWYDLIEQRGQRTLLDGQIRTNQEYAELVSLRFGRGRVPVTDVLQQRQLVESTQAEKVLVDSRLAVLAHQLAALLGRPPSQAAAAPQGTLPTPGPLPATGLPAALIRRRPDVRAAYHAVRAADLRVAAAIADRFPRVSLTARAETSAGRLHDLFDNWLASLAANLTAPLLDGGLREAEVDRTRAAACERLHAYGQTTLNALTEVEDALAQERQQRRYVASLARQLDLSRKALAQTRERYTKGLTDYLRVLSTLQAHQRLERESLRARRELLGYRIDLYRALAGGWPMPAPPTRSTHVDKPRSR